jgi:hypothetical protein
MPAYGTLSSIPALHVFPPMHAYLVFSAEALTLNEYSQQVNLPPAPRGNAKGIRVVIDFNQNPGNVEIDVLEADNDSAGKPDYVNVPTGGALTQASLTTGPNGASTRLVTDLIPVAGQFIALFVKVAPSNANTTCSARISRAA